MPLVVDSDGPDKSVKRDVHPPPILQSPLHPEIGSRTTNGAAVRAEPRVREQVAPQLLCVRLLHLVHLHAGGGGAKEVEGRKIGQDGAEQFGCQPHQLHPRLLLVFVPLGQRRQGFHVCRLCADELAAVLLCQPDGASAAGRVEVEEAAMRAVELGARLQPLQPHAAADRQRMHLELGAAEHSPTRTAKQSPQSTPHRVFES
eukprot:scaffold294658_cov33-Tisochrysis_lutea.AAC.1